MKHLSLSQPHMLLMVGIPGSGKTFFAEKFAETFSAPYVDHQKIARLIGDKNDIAEQIVDDQLHELFKTRQTIIIEGNTETRSSRIELTRKAHKAGYEPLIVWVQIDNPTAQYRTTKASKTNKHPLSVDDFNRQVKRFTAPGPAEKSIVISGKHTYASQAKTVLQRLSAPRTSSVPNPTIPERPTRSGPRSITIR